MLSPFAPLYPWLLSAVMFDTPMCVRPNGRARLVSIQRTRADGPTQYKFAEHRATWTSETPDLDLRHGPTRYAILRALADAGHPRSWALGAPWSPLTDEQAGRVTAEIVRAVGADPSKPAGVVPSCVLGGWREGSHTTLDRWFARKVTAGPHDGAKLYLNRYGTEVWVGGRLPVRNSGIHDKDAADNAARALGCIMIEDVTP